MSIDNAEISKELDQRGPDVIGNRIILLVPMTIDIEGLLINLIKKSRIEVGFSLQEIPVSLRYMNRKQIYADIALEGTSEKIKEFQDVFVGVYPDFLEASGF